MSDFAFISSHREFRHQIFILLSEFALIKLLEITFCEPALLGACLLLNTE